MTPEEREADVKVMAEAMYVEAYPHGVPMAQWPSAAQRYRQLAGVALDALLAPRKVKCETCGGTRLVDGWPLPGQGPVITQPITAMNQATRVQHQCPDCTDGTVTVDSPLVERGRLEQVGWRSPEGGHLYSAPDDWGVQFGGWNAVYVLRPEEEPNG